MEERNTFRLGSIQFFAEDTSKDEETKDQDPNKDDQTNGQSKDDKSTQQHFAEGARKENKKWLTELGVSSIEEAKQKLGLTSNQNNPDNGKKKEPDKKTEDNPGTVSPDVENLKKEVQELKAYKLANELGISKDFVEDAIAICVGKGVEVTEQSLQDIIKRHPDWKVAANGTTENLGSTVGNKQKQQEPDERTAARSMFGLK